MAYEINIHVDKSGKLETDQFPLELSVYRESKRVKLLFDVDAEIDSTYHYLKFTHKNATYLYRVHNNEFEIPKAITAYEGRWEMSFVACDEVANSDSTITANYIYASEPVVADVLKGNLGIIHTSEEFTLLSQLVEGTFDHFEIPNGCTYITSYFLSQASNEFSVNVPYTVVTIEDHAFYESGCTRIDFEEGSQLASLEDYALYRIPNLEDINFPASLSRWGNYNLSGCGKTTLINLILRFYDPQEGMIKINGLDAKTIAKEELRNHFTMVLQDTWIFSGTIYENIALGNKETNLEKVIEAAKLANCYDFIMKLPEGFNTKVSASSGLSQGEKQLICIARTFLNLKEVVILDEATSNVDARTELLVASAFDRIISNRTSIVIAHRLFTIKNSDFIIVMDEGKIVEVGTHDELLLKEGHYFNLYNAQYKED